MMPSTVPSRPMYGPPAMALDSEPSGAQHLVFLGAHGVHRGADGFDGGGRDRAGVGALLAAGADFIDRHAVQAPQRGMLQRARQVGVVGQQFQALADLGERFAEGVVGTGHAGHVAALANHDEPGLHHHHDQDGDDDPGVDRHGLEQEAQAAETEAGLLFVGAIGHQARFGALRGGVGQDQRGGAGDLGQAHFVDGAHERRIDRTGGRGFGRRLTVGGGRGGGSWGGGGAGTSPPGRRRCSAAAGWRPATTRRGH